MVARPHAPEDRCEGSTSAKSSNRFCHLLAMGLGACYFTSKPVLLHQDKENSLMIPTLEDYSDDKRKW